MKNPNDGELLGTIAEISGYSADELLELVGAETAEVVVQEGDISWYVAPYGGKWLSWDDADMRPHVMVHDSYDDAVLHQVQGAVEKGCEDCILPTYHEYITQG